MPPLRYPRTIADAIASEVIARLDPRDSSHPTKILWSESEAADVLGVSVYFLKRARQNGEVVAHSNTRPVSYTWEQIEAIKDWLGNGRIQQ